MRFSTVAWLYLLTLAACSSSTSITASGDRPLYYVGGTISGLFGRGEIILYNNAGDELSVQNNGEFQFDTPIEDGEDYNVTIDFSAHYAACTVNHASGTVTSADVKSVEVSCAPGNYQDNQEAAVVIGANRFGTKGDFDETAWGSVAYSNGLLFLSDSYNNRIFIYQGVPTTNGVDPIAVLGQATMTGTSALDVSASTYTNPTDLDYDGEHFIVTECTSNRVLIYNSLPSSAGGFVDADVVLGQSGDFTTNLSGVGEDAMAYPYGATVAAGRLLVADTNNNRVMVYNQVPTESGTAPDLFIGQPDAESSESGVGPSGLHQPTGVWTDGERILVADISNNRVLVFNHWPTTNAPEADLVLGQENFETHSSQVGASGFSGPSKVVSDGTKIFVLDNLNHRLLIWDQWPTENGAAADHVIGQPNFNANDSGLSSTSFNTPWGLRLIGNQIVVTDFHNGRLLVFNAVAE